MTSKPRFNPHIPAHTLTNQQVIMKGQHAPAECANYHCTGYSGFLDSPFCEDCLWRLWAHLDETFPEDRKELARQGRIDAIHQKEAAEEARSRKAREEMAQAERHGLMSAPGVIYYLRVGDLIKIGYTWDVEQRMRYYPPNSELLATHPGTRETERQMHHKFLHRVSKGREWFTPCPEIDEHIEEVRSQFSAA